MSEKENLTFFEKRFPFFGIFGTIEKKMWGNQKTPDFLGK